MAIDENPKPSIGGSVWNLTKMLTVLVLFKRFWQMPLAEKLKPQIFICDTRWAL